MQNIDPSEISDTLNKFKNSQITQPTSLENLTYEQRKLLTDYPKSESSRTVHSDPEETQAKVKTRSRFSAALRKLSRSTRKKEKLNVKFHSSTTTESSDLIVSSGAEDSLETNLLAESSKKLRNNKKPSKSIFGLKKSKIVPEHGDEGTIINFEEPEETVKLLEPIFQDNENEVIITTEKLSPLVSRNQVQITIKSKKIETLVSSREQLNKNPSLTSSLSSSSQSLKSPTNTITNTILAENKWKKTTSDKLTSNNECVDKKKKLKIKIITQTPQKSVATATKTTTTTTAQSKSKQLEKKEDDKDEITITQSSKDTPPKEKAPTKPSRLTTTIPTTTSTVTTISQSSLSSGVVRKTATKTRAAIKLVTAAKSKQKPSSSKVSKGSNNSSNTSTNSNIIEAKKETLDLMINPQRGHRLPRPISTITIATTTTTTASTTTTTATTTNTIKKPSSVTTTQAIDASKIETIELPINLSNRNQIPNKPTSPDSLTIKSSPQTSSEIQYFLSNASLPSSLAPINNTQRQQQQKNIETSSVVSSVQSKTFLQTDDHISLAESVKPGEYLGDTHYNSGEVIKEPATVHFAVGSPVRPLFQQVLYEYSFQEPSVDLDKDLEDPEAVITEVNRRRIQYISQPTLYDELINLDLKRLHYRYHSGVSDLSLDTDENADIFDDIQPMPAFGDLTMDQDIEPTVMTTPNTEKREHLYKILVIGELGTGKTSFIKRYVHQFFSQNYRATIGVDFALKVLHWDPNTIVRLQLWDIAGQERFGNMTRVYYKEAVGAFIVFDVTRSGTFDCVSKWKEDLDSKVQLPDGSSIPCILLANKCDQDKQGVITNTEKMNEYVKEHGFAGWFETSAKENINIDEAARALVNKILLNDKLISAADLVDSEKFNLNNSGDQTAIDGKSKCSC